MGSFPAQGWMAAFQDRVNADRELAVIGQKFNANIGLGFGCTRYVMRVREGRLDDFIASPRFDVPTDFGLRAPMEVWGKFLSANPPPMFHDPFAMLMRVPEFIIDGNTLAAMQSARALHRMMSLMREAPAAPDAPLEAELRSRPLSAPDFEPITGRYLRMDIDGAPHRIFVEEAGQGIPLLCLHTAGADSRRYRHLLNDHEITARFRVVCFDMPWHGRSDPPPEWWLTSYELKTEPYLALIRQVWLALDLQRPVIMGCSMGGAIVLRVASDFPDEIRGIIGLESGAYAPGRYNDFLLHPAVHGGELVATYTFGLNAPMSPEAGKRDNWWYYAQGGPGIYRGDVMFYSFDWDAREHVKRIDTKRCKVSLLTGSYDYSCTPEMSKAVADAIPGCRYTEMPGIGHFPMIENYPLFRTFLMPELDVMAAAD
jgi:pimeloyl-ACP methyl ester carboxylesterase